MTIARALAPDAVRKRLRELEVAPRLIWRDVFVQEQRALAEAAVLLPLIEQNDAFQLVLTRRSENLRQHPGEISFPGGRADPEDRDLVQTALREADEEIALESGRVRVFGPLVQLPTFTGFRVTSFVGESTQSLSSLMINPDEIDELIVAPLHALADPAIYHVEERMFNSERFTMHTYQLGEHRIWGVTGMMLHHFLQYLIKPALKSE